MTSAQDVADKLAEDFPSDFEEDFVPTISSELNNTLGGHKEGVVGGVPTHGRYIVAYGPSGHGKTTIMLELCKAFCDDGQSVAFFDAENKLEEGLYNGVGLGEYFGTKFFPHTQIAHYGDLRRATFEYLSASDTGLIVVDSLKAVNLDSSKDPDEEDKSGYAGQARETTKFLEDMKYHAEENQTTLAFIQQERSNIGSGPYGPDTKMSGAHAVRYYADLLFRVSRTSKTKGEHGGVVQADLKLHFEKNCVGPCRDVELPVRYGEGVLPELLIKNKIEREHDQYDWIEKGNKGWWTFDLDGEEKVHGSDQLEEFCRNNMNELSEKFKNE